MAVNLVLRAWGLSDLLTAVPALRAIRRAYPDDQLILAAPTGAAPLLPLTGAVDTLLPAAGLWQFLSDLHRHDLVDPTSALRSAQDQLRYGHPATGRTEPEEHDRAWGQFRRTLEQESVRAVNLHDAGVDSIDCLQSMRPQELISFANPDRPGIGAAPWDDDAHEIDRWCTLLQAYGIDADPTDLRLLRPDGPGPCPGAAVVHPGGAYRSRRWPPGRFAEVARKLATDGHQVVITGNVQERKLCRWTADRAGLPESAVLAGRTDLLEFATVIAHADLVVCGDTGTGQLATGFDTRSVQLFGPTSPSAWGPTIEPLRHAVLWAGHTGDPYGERPDPGLLQLQVEEVIDRAREVLRAA